MGPRVDFDEKEEMGIDTTILNAGNNTPKKQTPKTRTRWYYGGTTGTMMVLW